MGSSAFSDMCEWSRPGLKRTNAYGPVRDALQGSCDHQQWLCGRGNRGGACAPGGSVDTCVSQPFSKSNSGSRQVREHGVHYVGLPGAGSWVPDGAFLGPGIDIGSFAVQKAPQRIRARSIPAWGGRVNKKARQNPSKRCGCLTTSPPLPTACLRVR